MVRTPARILFVTHTADVGGPAHSLLFLVRHLKERYGLAVLLPERGELCERLASEGIHYVVIPGLGRTTIPRILKLIRREGFDLVYGNSPSRCSRNAMLAAKLAQKPFVWQFRTVKWHWTWRDAFFLRWADEVVAVSHACAQSLRRFLPQKEINVIYNGVELTAFDLDRTDVRRDLTQQLGLSEKARYIVSVAHVIPKKGYEQAIEVMAQIVEDITDVHLIVAGRIDRDVQYTERIRAMIQDSGLAEHVHLLGLRTDIPRLFRACDVFLHTSPQEAHPRAVLEAMAAGLPVVAFAVGGICETVVHGDHGYLAPAGDSAGLARAVLSLLADPAKAKSMGQRGRERVERHFTTSHTADQVSQLIEKLLQERA